MSKRRHKYEYKVIPNTAAAKLVRLTGTSKRVLELGPGPGSITRLLKDNGCRVTALELDQQAIDVVMPFCEKVYRCDLNDANWTALFSPGEKFQVVVAGDVLEHLYDPWAVLRDVLSLLADDGCIVVSLPHVGHNAVLACLLNEDFEYQPWGLLDRTHIRFFGIKNIQKLFNDAGLKIVEAEFVVRGPEQTEFAKLWRRLPLTTRDVLMSNKFGTVYQVVVKAVPKSALGRGLRIDSLTVGPATPGAFSAGTKGFRPFAFILSFVGLRTREKIWRILGRMGFG